MISFINKVNEVIFQSKTVLEFQYLFNSLPCWDSGFKYDILHIKDLALYHCIIKHFHIL